MGSLFSSRDGESKRAGKVLVRIHHCELADSATPSDFRDAVAAAVDPDKTEYTSYETVAKSGD